MSFPAGRELYEAVPLPKGFRLDNAAVVLFLLRFLLWCPDFFR